MNWIELAAEKAILEKEEKERIKKSSEASNQNFLKHCDELWEHFHSVFEQIKLSFLEECNIVKSQNGNQLIITIALVEFKITVTKLIIDDHYHIEALLEYTCSHDPGKPALKINRVYLNKDESPIWVYKTKNASKDIESPFEKAEAEEQIRISMWKYEE